MNSSDKKHAVVTGATRGIGYAIAERLLADGFCVTVTGTQPNATHPKNADYLQADFTDVSSMNHLIHFLRENQVDVLVNNAGINKIDRFEEIRVEDFDRILSVNLRAPFLLCQAVIPNMKKKEWGRIVNISSIFGKISREYRASYSASKFGIDGMTIALSAELSQFGILANSVGPGFIDTELTRSILGQAGMKKQEKVIPIRRLGRVDEIASFVSWLVSEENTYLTGQNLTIDGGFTRV